MSADPRVALAAFVSALERHLEAASTRRGENDPTVVAAYQDLAEAFDRYDDALMDAYGEVTPLEIYNGEDEDEDEFEEENGAPRQYLGLDDEEFDESEDDDEDSEGDEDDDDDSEEDDDDDSEDDDEDEDDDDSEDDDEDEDDDSQDDEDDDDEVNPGRL